MNVFKNKIAIAIATFLIILMLTPMLMVPSASAHTPAWQITTYAWCAAAPNPCGVGQTMLIYGWLDLVIQGALLVNNIRFQNYQFTITEPNGQNVTKTFPTVVDSTSSQYFSFVPDQTGIYTVYFNFPGQVYNYGGAYQGDYYTPASATTTFTVQQNPIPSISAPPLPTAYWTRPIYATNDLMSNIASNWLGGAAVANSWQQNGAAPNSAHIMWTKPLEYGGLTGNSVTQAGNTALANDTIPTFYSGFSYNTRFNSPMIVAGVLYYQEPNGEAGSGGPEVAVDLTTGQTLWTSTTLYPTKAQMVDIQIPNQEGVVGAILWVTVGTTWEAFNAFTQQFMFNLTGVPSGTEVYDNQGNILRYVLSYSTTTKSGWLALWNDTAAMTSPLNGAPAGSAVAGIAFFPVPNAAGFQINASAPYAYSYNVSVTANLVANISPTIVGVIPNQVILGYSSAVGLTSQAAPNTNPWTVWALSDVPGQQGQLLWRQDYPAPPGNLTEMMATQPIDPVTNEWTMTYFETGQRLAYSLATGKLVWGPSAQSQYGFQYYSARSGLPAYGNLYVSGYGGVVFCYSMLNGTLLWTYGNGGEGNTTNMGNNGPWGLYPTHVAAFADGKVYTMSGEHSPNTPLYKGELARCLDAFTGKEIWTLSDWSASGLGTSMAPVAIADGYYTFANAYDGQVYCVGKGPSATTVNVQDNVISLGSSVLIQGTVMDISAGTKQATVAADFPKGVPAVSDNFMGLWMSYVYQQQPRPNNATGVTVNLTVFDPNNNTVNIGQVTSGSNGMFTKAYTPDVPGVYTIYATFSGTNSYYSSYSETSINVGPAPATTAPTATPMGNVATQTTLEYGLVAIIVVIIIIGAVLAILTTRKHA